MILKLKSLNLSAGRPVAILNQETAKKLNIHADERIEIRCRDCRRGIVAVVDLAKGLLNKKEIGVSEEVFHILGLKNGNSVDIQPSFKPLTAAYITKKIRKHSLNYGEIYSIVKDIVKERLTEIETAYFAAAVGLNDMNLDEVYYLTKAMVKTGEEIKWKNRFVLDKHCCGGVAGLRTTPLVVSIIGAAIDELGINAIIPNTSSRAITSAAGTSDDIEILTGIEFTTEKLKKIVRKIRACFIWNGILGLAPADDKIIQVERTIHLESHEQLVASILAKKIAMGTTHVVMEIPHGNSAKFTKKSARHIKYLMNKIASRFNLKIKCLLTDGSQPVGNGIGPCLEMKDILSILRRSENRPLDLEERALILSNELMAFVLPKKQAVEICKQMLNSGKAYEKFKQILKIQGGSDNESEISKKLEPGKFHETIKSNKNGKIIAIDNKKIAYLCRLLGCPVDKASGIFLHAHVGAYIEENGDLFTLYAESKDKLDYTKKALKKFFPIELE